MTVNGVTSTTTTQTNSGFSLNNYSELISLAQSMGISITGFYMKDADGNIIGIDRTKLNEEMDKKTAIDNSSSVDTFVYSSNKTQEEINNAEPVIAAAKKSKNEINDEYNNALKEFAKYIDKDAHSNTEEGKIVDAWEAATSDATKVLGSSATNTTVISAASTIIANLIQLAKDSKSFGENNKASEKEANIFTTASEEDIYNENHKIETHLADTQNNIFANNQYFKSAQDTVSGYEEEEQVAV